MVDKKKNWLPFNEINLPIQLPTYVLTSQVLDTIQDFLCKLGIHYETTHAFVESGGNHHCFTPSSITYFKAVRF